MKYRITDLSDQISATVAQVFVPAQAPAILANLEGRHQVLLLYRDEQNWLELGFFGKKLLASEQFGSKRFNLRGTLTVDGAAGLIDQYQRESVAESIGWYPSLLEWRGLRFKHPRLFSLLNECYRIENALAMSVIIGIGVILLGVGFMLVMMLDLSAKAAVAPVVPYALLLAKRVEFVDRGKKGYDYKR